MCAQIKWSRTIPWLSNKIWHIWSWSKLIVPFFPYRSASDLCHDTPKKTNMTMENQPFNRFSISNVSLEGNLSFDDFWCKKSSPCFVTFFITGPGASPPRRDPALVGALMQANPPGFHGWSGKQCWHFFEICAKHVPWLLGETPC